LEGAPEVVQVPVCTSRKAFGRKNWLFVGSKSGGERVAAIYSTIETCKLNGIEPQDYIADVMEKIVCGRPASRWDEFIPWNWITQNQATKG